MNIVKKILKGVLLWVTALAVILFISGVNSIVDRGCLIPWLIVCAVLCCLCYKLISKEEFNILTGYKWFNDKIGGDDDF